ncbi:Uncharacterized protein CTYZ_00003706 [Cryptosporidium tyzzeri]|nr:Uncharacterized protein CTYZ_00003706 [Cryptosporidium tyzzeri]
MCFPGYKKKWGVSEGMHIRSFNLKIFLFKKNFGLCFFSNSSLFYVEKTILICMLISTCKISHVILLLPILHAIAGIGGLSQKKVKKN